MESFVATCAGAVLLWAWWHHRKVVALALWGIADILMASGIFCLMLGWTLHALPVSLLGRFLLVLAPALVWKTARTLDGKSAPLWLVLIGPVATTLCDLLPGVNGISPSTSLLLSMGYVAAASVSFWQGRAEQLAARRPMILLTAVHATMLAIGALSTLTGFNPQGDIPPVLSLFGLIHFESIIYALGTTVFLLVFVKERSEAVSLMAARIDPLTGIANRAGFITSAQRVIARCLREGSDVSVMMFDLDRFKAINDTHGHAVGDAVIRKFSEIALAGLRPNDVFGRLGGEEFAVVVPGASVEVAHVRAERIRVAFAVGSRFLEGRQINATVSCGIAGSATNVDWSLQSLLEEADAALYGAKSEGRNRVSRAPQSKAKTGPANVIRVA